MKGVATLGKLVNGVAPFNMSTELASGVANGEMVDGGGTLRDRQVALEPKSEDHVRGALA